MPKKIFIFGLNGATWNIINPLIAKGDLPNLCQLKKSGASGNLRSLEPAIVTALIKVSSFKSFLLARE